MTDTTQDQNRYGEIRDWSCSFNNNSSEHTGRLWIFMIGGASSSIIAPLIRYFVSEIQSNVIVPVFIDHECHSHSTSKAISEISIYEEYCRLSCNKSKIAKPFLFIEKSYETLSKVDRYTDIIRQISGQDEVFIAFSAHSDRNVSIALGIGKACINRISSLHINYGIFLPHLIFATNEDTVTVLENIRNFRQKQILYQNLKNISINTEDLSTKFVIGLSHKIIVKESTYQKNPFNIVSLIMAYVVATSFKQKGGYMEYGIFNTFQDFLIPSDLVREPSFRDLLIKQDFIRLSFDFLRKNGCLPKILEEDNNTLSAISDYIKSRSDSILSLGDITIHTDNCMFLRKTKIYDFVNLNVNFKKRTLLGPKPYSIRNLTDNLTKHQDRNMIINSNMAFHELLGSINHFINENFESISKLYY